MASLVFVSVFVRTVSIQLIQHKWLVQKKSIGVCCSFFSFWVVINSLLHLLSAMQSEWTFLFATVVRRHHLNLYLKCLQPGFKTNDSCIFTYTGGKIIFLHAPLYLVDLFGSSLSAKRVSDGMLELHLVDLLSWSKCCCRLAVDLLQIK